MTQYCHRPGCETAEFDDVEFLCPTHNAELRPEPPPAQNESPEPPPDGPDPAPPPGATVPVGSGRAWSTQTCWNCGAASPNPGNTRCLECPESLVPPRLVLGWDAGTVRLTPGESVTLGREGPHARLFRDHGNVHRRHARVGVDDDGTVWVEPLPTAINGVFRRADTEDELAAGRRHELHDGETLRFSRNVTAVIAVYALPGS